MKAPHHPALPLQGGRRKPAPRPRTEGIVRLDRRRYWYVRLYPQGCKRAVYLSTQTTDHRKAEELVPGLRGEIGRRGRRARQAAADDAQLSLF